MSTVGRIVMLVALWLLAWGELSLANVLSGVAVASVLLVAFPPLRRTDGPRLKPFGVVRLVAHVGVELVRSNLIMVREIVRRRPAIRPGVLAHRLQRPSEEVVTIMTSVISLSPGTMVVDVDRESTTVYVHFLLLHDVEAARASLARLEHVAVGAMSTPVSGAAVLPTSPKESS